MSATLDPRRREVARLAELNRLGAMQPETDRVLQELVDDAREVFGTEFCMVNLVTADAQFFKVWSGEMPSQIAAVRQSPRERTMCRHVVEDEQPFVVEDFLTTKRFREQHLRMGPGVRFYAGTPSRPRKATPSAPSAWWTAGPAGSTIRIRLCSTESRGLRWWRRPVPSRRPAAF